jgi:cytosine/adenosine deaminase-related metal-dependent hydrolase
MGHRRIIKGACVITMDPGIGILERGDILIEGEKILEVASELNVEDAELIDGTGTIAIPGLIDTHRHLSHTQLRTTGADDTNFTYMMNFVLGYLAAYRAEDVFIGTLAGALEALEAGVTTVVDFADCMLSPDHADESVRAHKESGIRSVLCYGLQGGPKIESGKPADLANLFTAPETLFHDARRIRETRLPSDDGLVTMGLSASSLEGQPLERARSQLELGRELGLRTITAHAALGTLSGDDHLVQDLGEAGLLGADILISHGNGLLDSELELLAQAGASIAASPENEMSDGFASVTGRALAKGVQVSLGADSVTYVSGDMFRQIRYALHFERAQVGRDLNARGLVMPTMPIKTDVGLELATIGGARAIGLDHLIGSITPGRQADIALIRFDHLSFAPVNDPVKTLVMMASAGDVDTVFVAGSPVKREGRLLREDLPAVFKGLEASRDHLEDTVKAMDLEQVRAQIAATYSLE